MAVVCTSQYLKQRDAQPHPNIQLLQKLFHNSEGVGAEVENIRGEDGVGFASQVGL
jgi:hypothetical protein